MKTENGWETRQQLTEEDKDDQLVEVYRNGEITKFWTFDEIRARAAEGL